MDDTMIGFKGRLNFIQYNYAEETHKVGVEGILPCRLLYRIYVQLASVHREGVTKWSLYISGQGHHLYMDNLCIALHHSLQGSSLLLLEHVALSD